MHLPTHTSTHTHQTHVHTYVHTYAQLTCTDKHTKILKYLQRNTHARPLTHLDTAEAHKHTDTHTTTTGLSASHTYPV